MAKKTAQQRQFEQVKNKLDDCIASLEEVLKLIPQKGLNSSDCQKINLMQSVAEVGYCANGLQLQDFEPNDYSGEFEFSYSGDK